MGTSVTRQTVNMPDALIPLVKERCEKMGYRSFTDYVETLIRSDLAERPVLIRGEDGMVLATVLRPVAPRVGEAEDLDVVAITALNKKREDFPLRKILPANTK